MASAEIQKTSYNYYTNLYINKLEDLEEMESLIYTDKRPKLNQKDLKILNNTIFENLKL